MSNQDFDFCPEGDMHYGIWSERSVIADCLSDLGMKDLSTEAVKPSTSQELISKFLNIIQREANKLKRHDVIERLQFAGLIYG
jgi:hypothetical protein